MLQFFPFILLFIILFIYIKNKNKQASPKLLETRTKLYKELTVNCSVDKAYRAILQFGQSSDYKIDYTDNAKHQLILNYIPKMGEQTNGTFFPIWIEALNERTSKVYVGSKDKSLAMAFEEKKALNKIIPLLEAALYSIQPSNHEYSEIDKQEALDSSINKVGQKEKSFIGERIISNDKYKLFLIDKYNIKKNDVLNQYVCDEKLFTSVDEALSHGASIEELKIKEITANELLLTHKEQEHIAALALLEKKEQERNAAAAESLRIEKKKAEDIKLQKQIMWKAGAPKRRKIIAAFAILFAAITILILNKDLLKENSLGKTYSSYRTEVIGNEWQPYIRTNRIKEWSPPYPEVEFCYEHVCEASFINPQKNKVRYIVYSICTKDGHIKCPNRDEGFEVVDKDIIIDKLESDSNFLQTLKQFSLLHAASEEIEVSSSVDELSDNWKVIWRLNEQTGDVHGYFFRKNSAIDQKITAICPPEKSCKFRLVAENLNKDVLEKAFNGNDPDISSYSLIIKAVAIN